MGLRDIVVLLDASPASEERLRLAARMARDHGAHLSAVFVHHEQVIDFSAGAAGRSGLANQFVHTVAATRRGAVAMDSFDQRLRDNLHWFGADASWHEVEAAGSARLIAGMRTADLIILGQSSRDVRPGPPWRPDDIVVECGCPVLLVPYAGTFDEVGRRVLVAWDGSREATRALNDALPVIRNATSVIVMMARARDGDLQRDREATQRVLRHLERHDIRARADHPLRSGIPVSDILLSAATDFCADLIVAGAYHHSPLREALIGGVSRELLQHMTVPMLMSH